MAVLALLALVTGSTSACSGGASEPPATSTRVDPVQATVLHTGNVSLRIPPGAASGGTVTLTAATPPSQVPVGLTPLGPAAAVLLAGGTMAAPATLSFLTPASLRRGDLPVVVWRTRTGWTWLPTSWRSGDRTLDVSFSQPSAGYLAKVDVDSWVEGLRKSFVDQVTTAADVSPPYCAGQADAVSAGLASGSDPGAQVRWCVGVEDGQPVVRVTNETKLVSEVTFPEAWQVAPGEGATGAAVRSALGLGTAPPVGRATRYIGGGETLTLHPASGTPSVAGQVIAELTPAAWTVSALLAGADAYSGVIAGTDERLGQAASTVAHGLPADLAAGLTPGSQDSPSLRAVHDCMAPVAGVRSLDPADSTHLLRAALHCVPHYFTRTLGKAGADPAGLRLADHLGAVVLNGLRRALADSAGDWDAFPGTTKASAYHIWLGPPPPQELDYESAPMVFPVGGTVDVPAWSREFQAYVRERLDYLVTNSDAGSDAGSGCPNGSFTVRRYRSDGFALAGQVSCGGVPYQLVLKRTTDGWHEIADVQAAAAAPGAHFSCDLLRLYSVPAFIAGDQCTSGSEVQDYP
jgi:hypothetical protein